MNPIRFNPIILLARLTLLETVRSRHFLLVGLLLAGGYGLAMMAGSMAVTESASLRVGMLAGIWRLGAVLLVSLTVVAAMTREFQEQGIDLFLALPLPRGGYYLGKLAGFALAALFTALILTVAALPMAPALGSTLLWGGALACELLLVAAISLLFVFTFSQTNLAMAGVIVFYLLARSLAAFRLMAGSNQSGRFADTAIQWFLDVTSWLLPALDRFTPSSWLVYQDGDWLTLGSIAGETLVYLLFIIAAGMFDLHRKNF